MNAAFDLTHREWLDGLKVPSFLDRDVLLAAGVIADDDDWRAWIVCGWLRYIIVATDEQQLALFGLVQAQLARRVVA